MPLQGVHVTCLVHPGAHLRCACLIKDRPAPGALHGLLCLQAAPQMLAGALVEPHLISAAVSAFPGANGQETRAGTRWPVPWGAARRPCLGPGSGRRTQTQPHCDGALSPAGQAQLRDNSTDWAQTPVPVPAPSPAGWPQACGSSSLGRGCSSVSGEMAAPPPEAGVRAAGGEPAGWPRQAFAPPSRYCRRVGRELSDRR